MSEEVAILGEVEQLHGRYHHPRQCTMHNAQCTSLSRYEASGAISGYERSWLDGDCCGRIERSSGRVFVLEPAPQCHMESFLTILFCAYICHSCSDFEHDCPTAQLARQSCNKPSRYGSSRRRCRTAFSLFTSTFLELHLLRPSSNCQES